MAKTTGPVEPVFADDPRPKSEKVLRIVGYVILSLMAMLIVMLCSGDVFKRPLAMIGLYNDPDGLYVDCRDRTNRGKNFCIPDIAQHKKDWARAGDKIPFNLQRP